MLALLTHLCLVFLRMSIKLEKVVRHTWQLAQRQHRAAYQGLLIRVSFKGPRKPSMDAYWAVSTPSTQPSRPDPSASHSSTRASRRSGSRCVVICGGT